jgi:uncharacterized protein YkwD
MMIRRRLLVAALLLASIAHAPATAAAEPKELRGILAAHNGHRARHCAPRLSWSTTLARAAQRWADRLRDAGCAFEHSRTRWGENLAMATGPLSVEKVVDMWVEEVAAYDFRRPGFSMETGHFTQVVWAGSRRLGCGVARCKGRHIWVCNYDPAGNVRGKFAENVRPASCAERD